MAKSVKSIKYYEAVGRRKEAVARVRLYIIGKDTSALVDNKKYDKGTVIINDHLADEYFSGAANLSKYKLPMQLTDSADRYVTSIHVQGGGTTGQLEAIMLGISRALQMADQTLRAPLKSAMYLSRDPRIRERRKVGTGGKARRAKQSPKR